MTYRFKPSRPPHVAIVGSRHLTDYRSFARTIRELIAPWAVIVSGGADGIDSLAARYARQNHHKLIEHPVDLQRVRTLGREGHARNVAYGIAADERNQLVVNDSDRMIAFMCEHSKGTPKTIAKMRRKLELGPKEVDMRLLVYVWPCDK